jgi:hypothetical protein
MSTHEPTFKFCFRVSTSTGQFVECKNGPGSSVNAEALEKYAQQFLESLPAVIEHAHNSAQRRVERSKRAPLARRAK